MENIQNCPICIGTSFSNYISCIDQTHSKSQFHIVVCNGCGFKFTNPRPDINEISEYYESDAYISHSNSSKGIINKVYKLVRKRAISSKLSTISKYVSRGTILDIGCGTGDFLSHCQKKGWEITGIEPSAQARMVASEVHKITLHDTAYISKLKDASFDVVTLWHVLEHIHKLQDRIQEIYNLLKPGGIVLIAVPNHISFDASHYKEHWAAYDLPRHLYHFEPNTLIRLFKNKKFNTINILPMKYDSFYVSMLSEKYKNKKSNYLSAASIGFLSNLKARIKNNNSYSSQLYIFQK